jgi:predicted 3-demethylubiquinone-9 3-methyltransferase (glyoxalase superfamily)
MTQMDTPTMAAAGRETPAPTVRACLTFAQNAEEAINFYVSLFRNSKIVSVLRSDGSGPLPEGSLLHATFQLDGQEYTAFDGGPSFKFSDAFSLVVTCETQEELDEMWTRLAAGGEEGPCGWLTDRFGVSWQVVPAALGRMMGDPASGNPGKVMEALLKMRKLDIATLEQAYRSAS